jgi:menaquinone-dependent protoporphyrinogen oxidase
MSRVLVAYASKHGATEEIAESIAQELRGRGHEADCLAERPLWLITSGPCGQADPSWAAPPGIEKRATRLGARGHVVFGGRMPGEPSNFIERAMVKRCPPEHRDLRDWDVIRGWARAIADELASA